MSKNIFTADELGRLSAEEIIEKIKYENYSLLTSLGAEKLRKEMVPVGKACHIAAEYFLNTTGPKNDEAKHIKNARKKIVKVLKKFAPAEYKKAEFPTETKNGLVIGFNHPSLGEILRLIMLKVDIFDEKPMFFPVNLPWYEAVAPDYDKLKSLGIIITPTITPSTWKKMQLKEGTKKYNAANKLKRDFRDIYTNLSHEIVKNGGVIFVAPSATRQATVFKTKGVYERQEEVIPTMSVLALSLYKDPEMNCSFLPIAILPPANYKRGLNFFKEYKIISAQEMTAAQIRQKYFKTKNPKRLENFDYDFHLQIAEKLPKKFWY